MNRPVDFLDFLSSSPSSFHAAAEVFRRLEAAGFIQQDPAAEWDATPGGHVVVRGGAVIAWWVPEGAGPDSAFRIVGAHTDSPGLMLKPQPALTRHGFAQVGVEVYGGPILSSWFDRDLAFAGVVALADGSQRLVHTPAIARVPSLAIHLYRSDEFTVDRQEHLQPIVGMADGEEDILDMVARQAGVARQDIVGHTLITIDAAEPAIIGSAGEFIASGRLDNLTSVYAGMRALQAATTGPDAHAESDGSILVLAAFDHEEVGSSSTTGAAGPLLGEVLTRTARGLGADEEQRSRIIARSTMVSADAAHSVHPNYPGKHDPSHHPLLNHGPVTKINASQRYATTAHSAGMWERACRSAGLPTQTFVGNNSVPCGSTIGPISATRLGIDTVDVGVPLLSMHSARELCGIADMEWFAHALEAYLIGH